MRSGRCVVVIPTLGTRPTYLARAVDSVRSASDDQIGIVVVRPLGSMDDKGFLNLFPDVVLVNDPGRGLAAAINHGFNVEAREADFFSWLGDDDLLESATLDLSIKILSAHPGASFLFGGCRYIDGTGRVIGLNKSGRWAVQLLRFGPQLIPQPGSLIRSSSFRAIGGLDEGLKWAFDLDMFIRLAALSKPVYCDEVLASFRWHDDSLSVGSRGGSVREASQVRQRHLGPLARIASAVWEPILRSAILLAGSLVTYLSSRRRR